MNFRNSLYNAPARKVSKTFGFSYFCLQSAVGSLHVSLPHHMLTWKWKRRACPDRGLFCLIGAFWAKPKFAGPPFRFPRLLASLFPDLEQIQQKTLSASSIHTQFAPYLHQQGVSCGGVQVEVGLELSDQIKGWIRSKTISKKPFFEQLSEFWGIRRATLGIALTTI